MNTAIVLITILILRRANGIVIKDDVPLNRQASQPTVATATSRVDGQSFHAKGANDRHIKESDRSKGLQHSAGGISVGHHESGKRGEELKEAAKKEYGGHHGNKNVHSEAGKHQTGGDHHSDKKHNAHHKEKAHKKKKKISKGFHEEYHKDETKATKGHWQHEHTEGKFIKYGKKKGNKGSKKAKKTDQVEKRTDDSDVAGNFNNMDKLLTVIWATNKKPSYQFVNHSTLGRGIK